MGSKTLVTVEEYLSRSFDGPEPEYVDGEVIARHLGSTPHFKAQKRLLRFFDPLEESWSLFAYTEVTLRLSPRRYRVADIAVFIGDVPSGKKYPADPPELSSRSCQRMTVTWRFWKSWRNIIHGASSTSGS